MRRVLGQRDFARWLKRFLPDVPTHARIDWLVPGRVLDAADGKLAHLDGLNLSRAWMLEAIAGALPPGDRRVPALRAAARRHSDAGLAAVGGSEYAGGHWLGACHLPADAADTFGRSATISAVAPSPDQSGNHAMSIQLTAAALKRMQDFLARTRMPLACASASGTGCSGRLRSTLPTASPRRHGVRPDGARAGRSEGVPFVDGTEIDLRRQGLNAAFVPRPNATGECGCGESFTIETAT